MPRQRTVPDEHLLEVALAVVRERGPEALTFGALAARVDLAASTLVQRFGTKAGLLRAALTLAWDRLDAETASATADAGGGAAGVVDLLVRLTGQYDPDDEFADQLLILREDLRDPVLRARGRAWIAMLVDAIEQRLEHDRGDARGLGALVVTHWQGSLTVWSFERTAPLHAAVRASLDELLARLHA